MNSVFRHKKLRLGLAFLLASLWLPGAAVMAAGFELVPMPVAAAAGSVGPNLTRGPDGTIVLSWQEPFEDQTLLRFSRLDHAGWSEPRTVAVGNNWFVNWADFPSVLAMSNDLWAAHWLSKRAGGTYAYDVTLALSSDGGETWGQPITPHRDNTATEHGFVSLYPAPGGVGLIWLDGRNTAASNTTQGHDEERNEHHSAGGMTLRHARFAADGTVSEEAELDELVCDCCQTSVALAQQGPVAVYRNRTKDEIRDIYLTRRVNGQWQPANPVHADGWKISGCPVNGPVVAADGNTVAVAWFTMADEIARVRFARSEDGGASFGAPVDLSEASPLGRVDVVLLDDGDAVVSWLDEQESGTGLLRLQRLAADGTLEPGFTVTQLGTNRPSGFPQLQTDGKDLIVAWTAQGDHGPTVQSARIILPARKPANTD